MQFNLAHIVGSNLLGIALGAGAGWYFTGRYYSKKHEMELNAFKEHYDERISALENKIKELSPTVENKEEKKAEVNLKIDVPSAHSILGEHYNFKNIEEVDEEKDEEVSEAARFLKEKEDANEPKEKPYLITEAAFCGDDEIKYQDNYQHISLDYFAGDDVVCLMDSNNIVEDPERILGYDWKLNFGNKEYNYEEDCVFVRNDQRKTDYEIVRDKGYFCQIVLGEDPIIEE